MEIEDSERNQENKEIFTIDTEDFIDCTESVDSDNECPIYPLNNTWCIWEHQNPSGPTNYGDNLSKIGTFDTVNNFFRYWNNIPFPNSFFHTKFRGRLKMGDPPRDIVGFSMFKEGIHPSWEDPVNCNGAEWRIRKFNHKNPVYELEGIWIRLLLLVVGESETQDLGITGIRVVDSSNVKNKKCLYNVEIWFDNKNSKKKIEQFIKNELDVDNTKCFYRTHDNSYN